MPRESATETIPPMNTTGVEMSKLPTENTDIGFRAFVAADVIKLIVEFSSKLEDMTDEASTDFQDFQEFEEMVGRDVRNWLEEANKLIAEKCEEDTDDN